MLKRICPICDQPMGISNYCKTCHQFVHPIIEDRRYYLNESHPLDERNCDYHGHDASQMMAPSISAAQMQRNNSRAERQAEKSLLNGSSLGRTISSMSHGSVRQTTFEQLANSARDSFGQGGSGSQRSFGQGSSGSQRSFGQGSSAGQKKTSRSAGKNGSTYYVILIIIVYILMKFFFS